MERHNPASVCARRNRLCVQSGNGPPSRNGTKREPVHQCQNASRVFQAVECGRWYQKLTTSLARPRRQLSSCPRQGGRHSECGAGPFLCCGELCTLTGRAHARHSPRDALTAAPLLPFPLSWKGSGDSTHAQSS